MVYRSIILSVMVVVCTLQGALGQTSITTSSGTRSPTATPSTSQSPSTTSTGSSTATSATISPTVTIPSPTASSQQSSVSATSPTSPPDHSTEKPTTIPPSEKTCGNISIELKTPWEKSYENSSSNFHKEIIISLEGFFGDSSKYSDVNVRGLTLKLKAGKVTLNAMLCLVVKSADAGLIEDKLAKDGKIGNITVVVGSLKFTPLGIEFSDFKVKDGECDKCSGGGAGPIVMEGKCKANTGHSCKGVKTTKETNECVKYCDSSAVAVSGISTLILTVGVLLSFRCSFWG